MPRLGNGQSLKLWKASVDFQGKNGDKGERIDLTVEASNLQGAAGRAARLARKQAKGRFVECTVNVYLTTKEAESPNVTE